MKSISQLRKRTALIFLIPVTIVLLSSALYPLISTLYLSLTDAELENFLDPNYVGFINYLENYEGMWYGVLADSLFWNSVRNTIVFSVFSVSLEVILGISFALIMLIENKLKWFVRAAVLIPWAIPTIVSARMFEWMLQDQFGIFNYILIGIGIIEQGKAWTTDPQTSMIVIIIIDAWKTSPFVAILVYAGLKALPNEVLEAGKVDGTNGITQFYYIIFPLILPAIAVAIVFRGLDALRVFDLIYLINAGSKDIMSMTVYARREMFEYSHFGFGAAASTMLTLIIGVIAVIFIQRTRLHKLDEME